MENNVNIPLTYPDLREFIHEWKKLESLILDKFDNKKVEEFKEFLFNKIKESKDAYDNKNLSKALLAVKSAYLFAEDIDPDFNILVAIALHPLIKDGITDIISVKKQWGEDVAGLLTGLFSVDRFSNKNHQINQENFRGLLLSLADDIRVIIIMIVQNLVLMRSINTHPDQEWVRDVAFEANYLYAQLAHRLGLYKLKSELEDLALKYSNRDIYRQIAKKLNETKRSRDAYVRAFIKPLSAKLKEAGLKFEIKGRTKSISSIWNKMKKQKVDLPGIYDLFAIRVILDSAPEKEKAECWLAYSILADMYTANPSRMRDWISIPKSNGYESLHATVMGPDSKWVEVQFRTRRMDLIAEKGLAAHWRYKGVKSDSSDQWMNNIRDILETADHGPMQLMKDIKKDIYGKEVYAFTPKGDLFRLGEGATVLDFAFQIHTNVGAHCTGAIVNGQHKKITHRISNGDTIEILTSANQSPKSDWLNIVISTKARNKIKQSLNENIAKRAEMGRELLERRAKNRKLEIDEGVLMKLISKLGYKFTNEFFADLADEKIDAGKLISSYIIETADKGDNIHVSAEEYKLQPDEGGVINDGLIIGEKSINGLSYKMAGCCSPLPGDSVFGFISSDGIVKIHKTDCANALHLRQRYPYRLIRASWKGNNSVMFPASLKIIGKDDIGIVTNITSVISKEAGVSLRNINVDSNDGTFHGVLVVNVSDNKKLNGLIKKISTVKGVKQVSRI